MHSGTLLPHNETIFLPIMRFNLIIFMVILFKYCSVTLWYKGECAEYIRGLHLMKGTYAIFQFYFTHRQTLMHNTRYTDREVSLHEKN